MVQKWPVKAAFLLLAKFSQNLDYYYFIFWEVFNPEMQNF
jgi:hypothetical protein